MTNTKNSFGAVNQIIFGFFLVLALSLAPTSFAHAQYEGGDTTSFTPFDTTSYTAIDTTSYSQIDTTTYSPIDTTQYASINFTSYTPIDTTLFTPIDTTTYSPIDTTTYTAINTTSYTPIDTTVYTPIDTTKYTPIDTTTYTPIDTTTYTPIGTSYASYYGSYGYYSPYYYGGYSYYSPYYYGSTSYQPSNFVPTGGGSNNTYSYCNGTNNCNYYYNSINNSSGSAIVTGTPTYTSYPTLTGVYPVAAYGNPAISLSMLPYTGLDLGVGGTILYWTFLILWCLFAAYLIVVKRIHARLIALLFGEKHTEAAVAHTTHEVKVEAQHNVATSAADSIDPFIMAQIQSRTQA